MFIDVSQHHHLTTLVINTVLCDPSSMNPRQKKSETKSTTATTWPYIFYISNFVAVYSNPSGLMRIDKLRDNKFHNWKQKVILILSFRQLRTFVILKPPPIVPVAFDVWKMKDQTSMTLIGLSLSNTHLDQDEGTNSAQEIWHCILHIVDNNTLLHKLCARQNFENITMAARKSVLHYTNRVQHIAWIQVNECCHWKWGTGHDHLVRSPSLFRDSSVRWMHLVPKTEQTRARRSSSSKAGFFKTSKVWTPGLPDLPKSETSERFSICIPDIRKHSSTVAQSARQLKSMQCGRKNDAFERCYEKFPSLSPAGSVHKR